MLKKLGRNIKFLIASKIIFFFVQLYLTPFIVYEVGKEAYGIYLLALTFTGYFGVLDFGMLSALVKYVAEYKGANDKNSLTESVNVSLSFFFLVGMLVALLLFASSFFVGKWFGLNAEQGITMRNLLLIAAVFSVFSWITNVFRGVARGLQMYNWEVFVNIGTLLVTLASVVILLNNGYGIISVMLVNQILNSISAFILYLVTRSSLGELKLNILSFRQPVFKKMFNYSFYLFLISLFAILIYQIDYVVIGLFLNVTAVAIYSIAWSIQQNIRSISPVLLEPAWPLSAEMEGAGLYDKQKTLLLNGTKLTTLVYIPIILITIIFAEPFINNWMGADFKESILPAQILLLFWLFGAYFNLGSAILTAKGIVKIFFWITMFNALLNLILSLILVNYLGVLGVALGTTIPMILIAFPLNIWIILKELRVSLNEFYSFTVARNIFTYFFTIVVSVLALLMYTPKNIVVTLLEMGLIYIIGLIFSYIAVLKYEEKKQLKKMWSFKT
ncbi:MAG: oligosaccharide flippase family protein [Planctomycetes bacterium]|nr:oligosaccharide flippase family protein [Planctomycetota bacterium]